MLIEGAKHPAPVFPSVDRKARMIDVDRAFAVVHDNEAGATIDERPKIGELDASIGGDDDDHGVNGNRFTCSSRRVITAFQ